ncbi:MAG TPA: class I SAM-dependent methyltransferase [Gemmatimonadales bacterium]|nr:class I SAM-dependent methyltransferase [Gemmatimonadales bacterium]
MTSYDNVGDFGLLYDSVPAYQARTDVGFYVEEARNERSILEIGCGTGRVLLPIARSGAIITGLDSSVSMLTRCGDRVEAEPAEVRQRVSLKEGDIRDFNFPDKFTLVIAPFRILQHLKTIDDQLKCLATVRRHLEPGGRFIFDVFNPFYALLVKDRSVEAEETPELQLTDGRFMRRSYRISRVRFVDQVNEVELIYYVRSGDATERVVQSFEMRWYNKAELEHLLVRAGFTVEAIYGGFDRRPLTDDAPEIIVVARNLSR